MTDTTIDATNDVRTVLEDFGVIQPPKLPKADVLMREIRKRGGSLSLTWNDKGVAVSVSLSGNTFDAAADLPSVALAEAFAQALQSEPKNAQLFTLDEVENVQRLRYNG